MAKLYGLHRSTLYEAVKRGRVNAGFDGKGQQVIDLSEMIRVYGEARGNAQQHPTPLPDTNPTLADNELLARFDALLSVVKEQRDELRRLREEVAGLKRLPAPEVSKAPEKPPEAASLPDDDPHGLRAIARALRGEGG